MEALFEAQMAGLDMALDIATGSRPMTESWIRQVHEVVIGPQQTYQVITPQGPQEQSLPKGEYKRNPNHVSEPDDTVFASAPVLEVASEMERFVKEAQSPSLWEVHPCIAASWLHYALIRIHPFADGNGRVTRVVASIPFLAATSVPLVVPADRRDTYLGALRAADLGDPTAFIRYLTNESTSTLRHLLAIGRTARPSASLDAFTDAYLSTSDVPIPRYDEAALRLRGLARDALAREIDRRALADVTQARDTPHHQWPLPQSWRWAVERKQ